MKTVEDRQEFTETLLKLANVDVVVIMEQKFKLQRLDKPATKIILPKDSISDLTYLGLSIEFGDVKEATLL